MFVVRAFRISVAAVLMAMSSQSASSQTLDGMAYGSAPTAPVAPSRPGLFTSGSNPFGALRTMFARPARAPTPVMQVAPPPASQLDTMAYGGQPVAAPPPVIMAAPSRPGLFTSGTNPFASMRRARPAPMMVAAAPVYAPAPIPVMPAPAYDLNYRLDAGDKLRVVVYGQEGLTNGYAVGASGAITMPLIGPVMARGMTPGELAGAITGRLRDGYIREPSVAVEIDAYRPFFILGEVAAPGQYPYVPNMTAESAVAIAGGFSPRARRDRVTLTHTDINGSIRVVVPPPTPISPGDTILVGERWF